MTGDAADLAELSAKLGHEFADLRLLSDAVTHPSLSGLGRSTARRAPGFAYERLEFLGDRVLGLVVAAWLLERFPDEPEGHLAKRHAALVRREALGVIADELSLGRHLRLSQGEADQGGRTNRAILADCCEAVIGALYLDGGLASAQALIRRYWAPLIERAAPPPQDAKTALQEWAQGRGKPLPVYETVGQSGPAHEPQFDVRVTVEGHEPVTARAGSKRAAEKLAATTMLQSVGVPLHD
ncbi:ribonuclease III [Arenibaculum sp.]|jgi:ribonuclease-3|uniref:ribonuclease III n=1 Tax=Arenibaculum sp. TaxID=2865862 RepID=UPI002E1117F0|nr:ribonuclease III [Arenibaculum sp.]